MVTTLTIYRCDPVHINKPWKVFGIGKGKSLVVKVVEDPVAQFHRIPRLITCLSVRRQATTVSPVTCTKEWLRVGFHPKFRGNKAVWVSGGSCVGDCPF
jgi:hypothetical protein